MTRALRAALVLALFMLPLIPVGSAGIPEAASWSPWTGPHASRPVTDIALSDRAETLVASLAPYSATTGGTPGSCVPPTCNPVNPPVTYDLAVFTIADGFKGANMDNEDSETPGGRSLVAASADGTTHVSVGLDRQLGSPTDVPRLYYSFARDGNWSNAGSNVTDWLNGDPIALAVSADGSRVAVVSNVGGDTNVKGYITRAGNTVVLQKSFDFNLLGAPVHMAASADLTQLLVAARGAAFNDNRSYAQVVSFANGGSVGNAFTAPAGVNLTRVAMDGTGARLAIGASNGSMWLFRGALQAGEQLDVGNATVDRIAFSRDGTRLAVAANTTLSTYDSASNPALPRFTAALASSARAVDYTETGSMIVVATSQGVIALGDDGRDLGWGLRGDTSDVDINADGSVVAYAQRNLVFALRIPRGLAFSYEGNTDYGSTRTISAGGDATYDLYVRNPGAAPERVVFAGPTDIDVTVTFEPEVVTVNPGETTRILARLTPTGVQTGSHSATVTARSLTSDLTDDVYLNFTIAGFIDVSLDVNFTEVVVEAGREDVRQIRVINDGTEDVAVALRAEQSPSKGGAWNVSLNPDTITVAPGTFTTVRVSVRPPMTVENGTSNAVTLFLHRAEGEVADQARVVYRINPSLGVKVTPNTPVKYVEAGKEQTFNVSVTNTGSLPRRFEVYYTLNETSNRAWAVRVPDEPFRLEPLQSRNITIVVVAHEDARPPDQLKFSIVARLLPEGTEPEVTHAVNLIALAAEPVPIEEDDGGNVIPLPPAAALVLVAGAAALVARRRRGE